jgi:hypothetical protein
VLAERVAGVLHDHGVPVALTGWSVDQAEPVAPLSAAAAAPASRTRSVSVEMWPVPAPYAGRIRPGQDPAVLIGCVPGLLGAAAGLCSMGYVLWYRNELPPREITLYGLGGLVLFGVSIWLGIQLTLFVTGRRLLSRARVEIGDRPDALFNPRRENAVLVQVVPRGTWEQGPILKPSDVGFLLVDQPGSCLLFEGDKERWRVPAAGLISCEVERASVHAGSDGTSLATQFVAVVRARKDGAEWEAPLCPPHLAFRPLSNRDRQARAMALRDSIRALLRADRPAEQDV